MEFSERDLRGYALQIGDMLGMKPAEARRRFLQLL
jgi:hypothetical protein